MSDPAPNQGKKPDEIAQRISRNFAYVIAALIAGAIVIALAMLLGWAIISLWGLLFG